MVVNSKFLHRCIDTQMFFFHGFYNLSLELRRISFVWYSFWHSKTPHFLDSISYCLTNGVQFILGEGFLVLILGQLHFQFKKEESSSIKEATGDYLRSRVPLIPWKRKSGGSLKEKAPIFQLKTAFPIFPEILLHIG